MTKWCMVCKVRPATVNITQKTGRVIQLCDICAERYHGIKSSLEKEPKHEGV